MDAPPKGFTAPREPYAFPAAVIAIVSTEIAADSPWTAGTVSL